MSAFGQCRILQNRIARHRQNTDNRRLAMRKFFN